MIPPIEDGVFYGPSGERMDTRPPIDRARLAALEAVAMAAASMVVHSDDGRPWWMRRYGEDRTTYCIGCGADSLSAGLCASLLTHAPDCPALALDAALAALRDAGGEA